MRKKDKILIFVITFLAIAMILFEFNVISIFSESILSLEIKDIVTRILGGIIALCVVIILGYRILNPFKKIALTTFLLIFISLVVSINNFPFIAFFQGNAFIEESNTYILVFAIKCFSVGFIEEFIYRGVILLFLLQIYRNKRMAIHKALFISALIFAGSHLFNLFYGYSFGGTFLQVSYSFLTGIMWGLVLLKTGNIWVPIILHSLYNFFGLIFFELGTISNNLNSPTIIITIILSLLVAIYLYKVLSNIKESDISVLYSKNILD